MNSIINRLNKNYKKLKKWSCSHRISAFRLYDRDIPEFPYIIDFYPNHVVIYERDFSDADPHKQERMLALIIRFLLENTPILKENIVVKKRIKQKGKKQYHRLQSSAEFHVVEEGEAQFLVNFHDYLDTGLFLDHRPLRQMIYQQSKDKKVLNLFSYTGTMSVMAALGGGTVSSVDLSPTYQKWAGQNFRQNNIDITRHHFHTLSVADYFSSTSLLFDMIILDPPTFSNSKRTNQIFEVGEDHLRFVEMAMERLLPSGVLYFSSNKRKFKLSPVVAEKYSVLDISGKTIPFDFQRSKNQSKIHQCFRLKHL